MLKVLRVSPHLIFINFSWGWWYYIWKWKIWTLKSLSNLFSHKQLLSGRAGWWAQVSVRAIPKHPATTLSCLMSHLVWLRLAAVRNMPQDVGWIFFRIRVLFMLSSSLCGLAWPTESIQLWPGVFLLLIQPIQPFKWTPCIEVPHNV